VALLLTQGAYNAGSLRLSLPTMTVTQPIVAVGIGLAMFGEGIDTSAAALSLEFLGVVFVVGAVFALGRSPIITGG